MKRLLLPLFVLTIVSIGSAHASCALGIWRAGETVVMITHPANATSDRYTFLDGRRGSLADADAPVRCEADEVRQGATRFTHQELRETPTTFVSYGSTLSGRLYEPDASGAARPLVTLVHGSERTSPVNTMNAFAFAAQGISVFVYDKRGTGASQGEYTQNFELLADDAAAALNEARRLAAGRFTRSGFFGGSQGGWVAPLAATKTQVDFVEVGYGLVLSPFEEDREQVFSELRAAGHGDDAIAKARQLTDAVDAIIRSRFTRGYETLARLKQRFASEPWYSHIEGEFTGDILRMSEADLRRIGPALIDNVDLIWDYDAVRHLRNVRAPQLWVLAGADREAPSEVTLQRLRPLQHDGLRITLYRFPDTDHGMYEFVQASDGTRRNTRITDGYLRLLGDWIKGQSHTPYGRGEEIR